MEWVKLSAVPSYYLDGALLRAGEAAEVLFCRGLAHCGAMESAGLIDKTVLPMLVARPGPRAAALVREGLWIDEGVRYRVRSWDKWQDAHDAAAQRRALDRERKRRERQERVASKAAARHVSEDSPRTVLGQSERTSSGPVHDVTRQKEKEKEKEKERQATTSDQACERNEPAVGREPLGFADWYAAYPLHKARAAAAKAYVKARRSASASDLLAAAQRYRDDPTRGFTAHPATWLNQGRWDDEGPAGQQSTPPATVHDQRTARNLALVEQFRQQEHQPELGA